MRDLKVGGVFLRQILSLRRMIKRREKKDFICFGKKEKESRSLLFSVEDNIIQKEKRALNHSGSFSIWSLKEERSGRKI